eukprot:757082_1
MSLQYGKIKFFKDDRGFGFILRKHQPDLFFHVSDVIADDVDNPYALAPGDKVEFVATPHKKNKWKACWVKKTNKASDDVSPVNTIHPNPPTLRTWKVFNGHEQSFHAKLDVWKQTLRNEPNTMLNFEVDGLFGVVDDVNILSKLLKALVDSIGIYLNSFKIGFAYGCCSYPGSYVSRADWRYIFSKCPHLQRIRLKEAHTVDNSVLNSISRYCPKATELEIIGNKPTRYEDRSGCEQCEGRIRCQDSYIFVSFHQPDGTVENKSIAWCVEHGIEQVSAGVWKHRKHSQNKNKQKERSDTDDFDLSILSDYFDGLLLQMSFTSSGRLDIYNQCLMGCMV